MLTKEQKIRYSEIIERLTVFSDIIHNVKMGRDGYELPPKQELTEEQKAERLLLLKELDILDGTDRGKKPCKRDANGKNVAGVSASKRREKKRGTYERKTTKCKTYSTPKGKDREVKSKKLGLRTIKQAFNTIVRQVTQGNGNGDSETGKD